MPIKVALNPVIHLPQIPFKNLFSNTLALIVYNWELWVIGDMLNQKKVSMFVMEIFDRK